MKIFAFYLPQFHEIPENNEWWGKGFTEWTNVKKVKKIYRKQAPPKVPLNNNYYNLLDKETVEWQTKLMDDYKVDGLIYYHYYFEGKKLLEKPAENLLKNKDINQKFFFCWANHSWNRAWKGSREVLLEQTYGDQAAWEEHFQYLLPFFNDERYEKKDNKPLFMFFRPDFKEKNDIIDYFDKRCIEEGFDGIYVYETCYAFYGDRYQTFKNDLNSISHVFYRQAWLGECLERRYDRYKLLKRVKAKLSKKGIGSYIWTLSGDKCLNASMKYKSEFPDATPGLFFEWDNTPRHGKRGYIITPVTHHVFEKYMNHYKNSEYMFVNAWNEWCEGMILEPTEEDGYKYLEWIKEWKENNSIESDQK